MDKKEEKSLKVYGVIRIVWGLVIIGGISLVYWRAQWFLRGSSSSTEINLLAIFDYIVAMLQGLFHVVSGIGIILLRKWAAQWLLIGWPTILTLNGVFAALRYQQWAVEGLSLEPWGISNWIMLIGLTCIVGFDLLYIRRVLCIKEG